MDHPVFQMYLDYKLLFQMSSRHSDCLSRLVRFCGVVGSNFGEPKIIRSHALRLLSTLLEVDPASANPSVLEVDALGLLVAFTFSLPSLFNEHQGPYSTDLRQFWRIGMSRWRDTQGTSKIVPLYMVTKVVGDTVFVDFSMKIAPLALAGGDFIY